MTLKYTIEILNRVKKFSTDHYGDQIQFCLIEMIDMLPEDENAQSQDEDDCSDSSTPESNQQNQMNCLFQMMYYQLFKGTKKTPLHVSFGQYQYGKGHSRETITVANHIGVPTSYNDVIRTRKLLATHAVKSSSDHEIPIPSTFTRETFTIGAMDYADFSEKSSISSFSGNIYHFNF